MTKKITLAVSLFLFIIFGLNAQIIPNLGADKTICQGDSLLLDAGTGKDHYLWNTGATTQRIYVKQAGSYSVTIDSAGIKGQTAPVKINLLTSPTISTPDSLIICSGTNAVIEAKIIGSVKSIQWEGFVYPNQEVLVTNFSANHVPGQYKVFATALSDYCQSKDSTIVLVRQNPKSIILSHYSIVPFGAKIDLKGTYIIGFGTAPYQGKWLPVDEIASVEAGTQGYSATTNYLHTGTKEYWLVTTDAFGCTDSTSTSVKIGGSIDITFCPWAKPLVAGVEKCENAGNLAGSSLIASTTEPSPSWQWYEDAALVQPIAGATASTYNPFNSLGIAPSSKTYYVRFSQIEQGSGLGCWSPAENVTRQVNVKPKAVISPMVKDNYCYSDDKIYLLGSDAMNLQGGASPEEFSVNGVKNTVGYISIESPSVNTIYNIEYIRTTNMGCKDSTSKTVTVLKSPVVNVIGDSMVCENTSKVPYT